MSRRGWKRTTAVLEPPDDSAERAALVARVHGTACGRCGIATRGTRDMPLPGPSGRSQPWAVCATCKANPDAGRQAVIHLLNLTGPEAATVRFLDVPSFAQRWGSPTRPSAEPWAHLTVETIAPLLLAAEARRHREQVTGGCFVCGAGSHPSGRGEVDGHTLCGACAAFTRDQRTLDELIDTAALYVAGHGQRLRRPGAAVMLGFVPFGLDDAARERHPDGCATPFAYVDLAAMRRRSDALMDGPGWVRRDTSWPIPYGGWCP